MPKTRPCSLCRIRPRDNFVTSSDLCTQCHSYAGWENTHSDECHDEFKLSEYGKKVGARIDDSRDACPVCKGVPAPWTIKEPEMTKTTTAKSRQNPTTSHFSHAACLHERTPKGRAECRKRIRSMSNEAPAFAPRPQNVKLGKGIAVHRPGGCVTTQRWDGAIERTADDVTCKNCLKSLVTADA